jgi:hypothetical protein
MRTIRAQPRISNVHIYVLLEGGTRVRAGNTYVFRLSKTGEAIFGRVIMINIRVVRSSNGSEDYI